jgi:hypothetical protein
MNEIKTHAQQAIETANLANNQKIITISILKCSNLKTVSSAVTQIAPYFTYQFFTYEEKYSQALRGVNPVFNDS